ncbi:Protein BIC1 [Linum perenne]
MPEEGDDEEDSCVREKLKRHRTEVAGRVWIPEIWGQEELLKDWTDCSAFDAALGSNGIMSARDALVRQGLTTTTTIDPLGLSVGNSF